MDVRVSYPQTFGVYIIVIKTHIVLFTETSNRAFLNVSISKKIKKAKSKTSFLNKSAPYSDMLFLIK